MKEIICRLCLQTIGNNNCQRIEESLLKSLKLNINICKENVMCIECANCLRIFSNFTPSYAYKGERTLPLSDLDNGVKLEPAAIEVTTNLKSFMKTEIECNFCTQAHGSEDLISLLESKDNQVLVDMLERYFLETNLKNTKQLLSCETCLEALQDGSKVISKCLELEEKISKNAELKATDEIGRVELKEVQQFMFEPIIKSEIESFSIDKLEYISEQVQEEYTGMTEAEIKYEKEISNTELIIKSEDDDIKIEQDNCVITDIKSEQSSCDGFQELFIEDKNLSETKMLQCDSCSYQTKKKYVLKRHLLTHRNPSEIKMFNCEFCSFQTKRKYDLTRHVVTHKNTQETKMFKCELCSYEAKQKRMIKSHLLIHKSPSEVKMFKCELCTYEARQKRMIKSHLLIHKSPSEIKMFKCEVCSYEAKRKSNIKDHLLTHKNPSEIMMFKCEMCTYEAKLRSHLNRHLLVHNIQKKAFRDQYV